MLILFITTLILFWNELRSLVLLKKVDNYGMYQMPYYGDYAFDEFLKVGTESDADIEAFVTRRLLKVLPIDYRSGYSKTGEHGGKKAQGQGHWLRMLGICVQSWQAKAEKKKSYKSDSCPDLHNFSLAPPVWLEQTTLRLTARHINSKNIRLYACLWD